MNWEELARQGLDQVGGSGAVGQAMEILALGGPVVMLLLALSVVMVAVALIKLMQFARAGVGRHGKAERAVAQWLRGDRAGARKAAAAGTVSAEVIAVAIEDGLTDQSADEAESLASLRLHQLRKMVGLLDTIAQISPLLGLFGTVLGMIEAFQALEGAGAAVDPSILAGGIWVALLTTAVGLAVAMPASVLASWFDARLENERVAMDDLLTRLGGRLRAGEAATVAAPSATPAMAQ